jgi:hypothetical protein
MESEEHQERWPAIGQSDVADVCREICESIVGLESAFEAGGLSSRLTSGCFEQVLGPLLYETYGKLADNAPGPLHHLRVDAVRALLAQLQNDLVPTQVAHAEVRMPHHATQMRTPESYLRSGNSLPSPQMRSGRTYPSIRANLSSKGAHAPICNEILEREQLEALSDGELLRKAGRAPSTACPRARFPLPRAHIIPQ